MPSFKYPMVLVELKPRTPDLTVTKKSKEYTPSLLPFKYSNDTQIKWPKSRSLNKFQHAANEGIIIKF